MATGDSNDILMRVKMLIPFRWFSWVAPLRDAVLGGLSDSMAWCYSWIVYTRTQSRIATSTGPFLDLISYDFLGRHLPRRGLDDNTFRTRIMATILQERVTRAGMNNALLSITGATPSIFEPWNTGDAGAWSGPTVAQASHGNFAWNTVGGWGATNLPTQVFLNLHRSAFSGVPNVGGWSSAGNLSGLGSWVNATGSSVTVTGPSGGGIELIGPSTAQIGVTDAVIYDTINTTRPTGSIMWTRFN
jgi:hypothetical protein